MAKERILVCITAQTNSKRLIERGFAEAKAVDGELGILHITISHNIFDNEETPKLLEELFAYGSERGGVVYSQSGVNIPETILQFIRKKGVTRLVLGEPPQSSAGVFNNIISAVPSKIKVILVERPEEGEQK